MSNLGSLGYIHMWYYTINTILGWLHDSSLYKSIVKIPLLWKWKPHFWSTYFLRTPYHTEVCHNKNIFHDPCTKTLSLGYKRFKCDWPTFDPLNSSGSRGGRSSPPTPPSQFRVPKTNKKRQYFGRNMVYNESFETLIFKISRGSMPPDPSRAYECQLWCV